MNAKEALETINAALVLLSAEACRPYLWLEVLQWIDAHDEVLGRMIRQSTAHSEGWLTSRRRQAVFQTALEVLRHDFELIPEHKRERFTVTDAEALGYGRFPDRFRNRKA